MRKMENGGDFIQWLGPDMSIQILTHLDDPSDIVRVSAVSRLWHQFGRLLGYLSAPLFWVLSLSNLLGIHLILHV